VEEIWKDIKGYEGLYQVSNLGRVKSIHFNHSKKATEKILKLIKDRDGYVDAFLYKNGKVKHFRMHRLVAKAFIPNPNNLPQINHIDENVNNNRVDNLEWCTVGYNINYGKRNEKVSNALKGRKRSEEYKKNLSKSISKSIGKKIICITTGEIFNTIKLAEIKYNIDHSSIIRCCKGKNKSAGKHPVTREPMVWRYIED
jgi:hypothetical protein